MVSSSLSVFELLTEVPGEEAGITKPLTTPMIREANERDLDPVTYIYSICDDQEHLSADGWVERMKAKASLRNHLEDIEVHADDRHRNRAEISRSVCFGGRYVD